MLSINQLLSNPEILKDVQIMIVDNDRDCRDLYAVLFEAFNAKVKVAASIKEALTLLDWIIPDILVCEMNFFGESVYPLIERLRHLEKNNSRAIPIVVNSTVCPTILAQKLTVNVEAYLLKPIDVCHLVNEVWTLVMLSKIPYPIKRNLTQKVAKDFVLMS